MWSGSNERNGKGITNLYKAGELRRFTDTLKWSDIFYKAGKLNIPSDWRFMFCGKSGNKGDGSATKQDLEDFVIVVEKIFTILDVWDRSEWNRKRFITGLGGKLSNVIFLFCFHFALITTCDHVYKILRQLF